MDLGNRIRSGLRAGGLLPALVLLAACGASTAPAPSPAPAGSASHGAAAGDPGSSDTSAAGPSPSVGRAIASPSPTSSAGADVLTGTWTTGEVSCEQWNAAIAKGGFTPEELKANDKDVNTHSCPATFKIRFLGGRLAIFVNDELGWNGAYKITDDRTFVAGDDCDYCVLYHFTRTGDTLTIDVVKDEDPLGPVDDHIVQTGIYESVPWKRVS